MDKDIKKLLELNEELTEINTEWLNLKQNSKELDIELMEFGTEKWEEYLNRSITGITTDEINRLVSQDSTFIHIKKAKLEREILKLEFESNTKFRELRSQEAIVNRKTALIQS
ncbi:MULTISPECIES: hypothetical protein [Methanobacterium]|uniref:Uncharacterized protein n=1 Tax=Methanobacterium bryantii TaxID=2161 RepID=A0A2A2H8L0_METBR|nr:MULTISPECIES: hypothetical protein [Methanobacterium]OEC87851.1 hypothetical protein A9507_06665 [Methanobacterium sp. A39]PAV05718.1 hypothetical protein ASJ80_08275 [Methanobacterium bryantii]